MITLVHFALLMCGAGFPLTSHIDVCLYVDMKATGRILKLLSDTTRLRIIMLLSLKELCVCQLMGVLGVSQPLVSRNLALLDAAGFLSERREGKLVFYSLSKHIPSVASKMLSSLKEELKEDRILAEDIKSLMDCESFQKKTGKCDMQTFKDFMAKNRKTSAKR